jgi:hypothetical protein
MVFFLTLSTADNSTAIEIFSSSTIPAKGQKGHSTRSFIDTFTNLELVNVILREYRPEFVTLGCEWDRRIQTVSRPYL